MKRHALRATLGISVCLSLAGGMRSLFAEEGGAIHRVIPCVATLPGGQVLSAIGFATETPSGNLNFACFGEIEPPPEETIVLNDIPCATEEGEGRAHLVATKSGNATLSCLVHPQKE